MKLNECCGNSIQSYDVDGELGSFEQGFPQSKSGAVEISVFKCKLCGTGWRRSMSYQAGGVSWEDCGKA